MSKKKQKETHTQQQFENIEESLSRSEEFIAEHQKLLTIIVAILVIIVLGFFGVKKYYLQPKEKEAQEQIYPAQHYFQADSLDKALYGDGNSHCFVTIFRCRLFWVFIRRGSLVSYLY